MFSQPAARPALGARPRPITERARPPTTGRGQSPFQTRSVEGETAKPRQERKRKKTAEAGAAQPFLFMLILPDWQPIHSLSAVSVTITAHAHSAHPGLFLFPLSIFRARPAAFHRLGRTRPGGPNFLHLSRPSAAPGQFPVSPRHPPPPSHSFIPRSPSALSPGIPPPKSHRLIPPACLTTTNERPGRTEACGRVQVFLSLLQGAVKQSPLCLPTAF